MTRSIENTASKQAAAGYGDTQRSTTASELLLAAIAGSDVGRHLQHSDHLYLELATQRALDTVPSGQTVHWCNPDTGNYGATMVYTAEISPGAQCCRDIEQSVTAGGRTRQAYGTARRQPDGSWSLARP